ncbi:Uncharacterized protein Fot_02410 [Forsythia ovata]|uniref:Uncharacterized protein n=1 Tax=Forsythia ovata TaxID=205694 RepID=A0ABD1X6S2_9LAMI
MSDEDGNTSTRQTGGQLEEGNERAPEVTQPYMCGRRSRARMVHNMEVMAEQMLEMQRQQVAQTTGLIHPAPPAYPLYQLQGHEYQRRDEEEDPYSYVCWKYREPHFRKMMEWIHLNTHIMGTTRKRTMETQTSILNTLKNLKPHKGPVSSTVWVVGLLKIGEKGGQQQTPLPKRHICLRHINTKPCKTLTRGTGFSYAVEITETIPNLYTSLHAPNQEIAAGQTGPSKSKKLFTGLYCVYHQFYEHSIEECRYIQALAEQRTQKKDHASFGRSRSRNNSSFRSSELRRRRYHEARYCRPGRDAQSRERGLSNDRKNIQRAEVPKRDKPPEPAQQAIHREIDTIIEDPISEVKHYHQIVDEPCDQASTTIKVAEWGGVEASDRGLFDFMGKKEEEKKPKE